MLGSKVSVLSIHLNAVIKVPLTSVLLNYRGSILSKGCEWAKLPEVRVLKLRDRGGWHGLIGGSVVCQGSSRCSGEAAILLFGNDVGLGRDGF